MNETKRFLIWCAAAFVAILLACCTCKAQVLSNTVAATYNFANFNGQSTNVRSVVISPMTGYPWIGTTLSHVSNSIPVFGQFLLPTAQTFSILNYPSMTNGTLTVSNLWTGIPYNVTISDFFTNAFYTNYFQTNDFPTEPLVDASTNQVFVFNGIIFPIPAGGVSVAAGTNGIQISTNGNVVTISYTGSTNGGGSGTTNFLNTQFGSDGVNTNLSPFGLIVTNLIQGLSNVVQWGSQNLTNWSAHSTNDFYGTNLNLQAGSAVLTNWAAHSTNDYYGTNLNLQSGSSVLSNLVTQSAVITNFDVNNRNLNGTLSVGGQVNGSNGMTLTNGALILRSATGTNTFNTGHTNTEVGSDVYKADSGGNVTVQSVTSTNGFTSTGGANTPGIWTNTASGGLMLEPGTGAATTNLADFRVNGNVFANSNSFASNFIYATTNSGTFQGNTNLTGPGVGFTNFQTQYGGTFSFAPTNGLVVNTALMTNTFAHPFSNAPPCTVSTANSSTQIKMGALVYATTTTSNVVISIDANGVTLTQGALYQFYWTIPPWQ